MFTRALIVLLLVLNLGVAAWWWLRPLPPAPPVAGQPAGVPRLQLLGEGASPRPSPTPVVPAAAANDAKTPQPEADALPATTEARCYGFGPFADPAAAEAARKVLQPLVTRLALRTEARGGTGAWNVWLPPLADRAAAQAMAQRIDAAGFKDYYVIAQGESANGIALGRFGSEDPARRHQVALQAAGFPAQVQAPVGAGVNYWLDAHTLAAFDPGAARSRIGAAQALPMDCGAG